MKTLKTTPGARRMMESLRHMGYDYSTAVADLVDNSIVAEASEIRIDIIPKQDSRMDIIPKLQVYHPAAIVISDNGHGMNADELQEAMRFGSEQIYSLSDLGKYGLGLKTASLSQCRIMTVSSKTRGKKRHLMRWDIDRVFETNEWNLIEIEENELETWEKEAIDRNQIGEYGTTVIWEDLEALPLLSSNNPHEREKFLSNMMDELGGHLKMVFHRFIQGSVTGHRKLNIFLPGDDKPLTAWDPFCRNETTKELEILRLQVAYEKKDDSKKVDLTISPFILPRVDEFSTREASGVASGPKNWNQQQGFYFYRNNRLIQAGGWNRIRTIDEHTKLLRIAVDFPGELDEILSINITKMKAFMPLEIRNMIETSVIAWVKLARSRYDHNIESKPDELIKISLADDKVKKETQENDHIFSISDKKDVETIIEENQGKWDRRNFLEFVVNILEAVYEGKVEISQIPLESIKKIYKNNIW